MRWTERQESDLDFRLEQIRQGRRADEIDELLRQQTKRTSRERGVNSEQRVIDALNSLFLIAEVQKASPEDDFAGNDLLVSFYPDSNHKDIPIQVKSSWSGYYDFLSHQKKGERRIVIMAGPGISNSTIRKIFLSRLRKFDGFI